MTGKVREQEARPEILVRKMEWDDVPDVAALERSIFSEPWTQRGFEQAIAMEQNLFLVAEEPDGPIAGYCGLYAAGDEGEITNVAVSIKMRRQGIGETMLEEILKMAGEQGLSQIFLEVRESNVGAICLYEKFGFEPCGRRINFYRWPDEDALCMRCEI
ncbi:MAG: ribosomal protein S18-alanine N-acetyltransferase [Lachnospiraceae bacterium]|nr:ribosomal protein S18-alanine N-acetyltransferase [Lachnospiraceae bacterium]